MTGNNPLQSNKSFQNGFNLSLVCLSIFSLILAMPMIKAWAGDAVIHLRIAELFSRGHFYEYNPGQKVMATTSLLWTWILALAFKLFGPAGVPWAVKILVLGLWVATIWIVGRLSLFMNGSPAKDSRFPYILSFMAAAAFALCPGNLQNATNGMEAILVALLICLLFLETQKGTGFFTIAVLACLACVSRPEGMMVCVLLGAVILWQTWLARRLTSPRPHRPFFALGLGTAVGIAIYFVTLKMITGAFTADSAHARLAAGLRESFFFGPFHFDPRLTLRLLAYFPLTLGVGLAARKCRPKNDPALASLLLILAAAFVLYSFVTGSPHTSRYWIPFFPLYAITAVRGWSLNANPNSLKRVALLSTVWLVGIYAYEYRARLHQGFGYDQATVVNAVQNRPSYTHHLYQILGMPEDRPFKIAATEVQVRYFISDDSGITIESLDGRTSGAISPFIDRKGLRHFEDFLKQARPDFIELGQTDPREPLLPDLQKVIKINGPVETVTLDGFVFQSVPPTHYVRIVKFPGSPL